MNGMDNTIEGTEWTGVMINEAEVEPNGDAWPAGKLNSIDDVLKPQGKLKYHHQDNDDPTIRSYQPSCILPGGCHHLYLFFDIVMICYRC